MSVWLKTTNVHFNAQTTFTNCVIWPSHGETTWDDSSVGVGMSAGIGGIRVWEHTHDYLPIVVEYTGTLAGWNLVTLVYSNRVPRLYLNGALVGQGSQSPRNPVRPSNGQKLSWRDQQGGFGGGGSAITGAGNWFRGQIDDLRIFNRALSDSEVQQLYAYDGPFFCSPHRATATASVVDGVVVGATMTDLGCGYTNPPAVLIQGGGGSGAIATATITNGVVIGISITSGGCCYTNTPKILIASPPFVPPHLQPGFSNYLLMPDFQVYYLHNYHSAPTFGPPTPFAPRPGAPGSTGSLARDPRQLWCEGGLYRPLRSGLVGCSDL